MQHIRLTRVATVLVATFIAVLPLGGPLQGSFGLGGSALAQQGNQQWFVPGQGSGQRPPASSQQRPPAGRPSEVIPQPLQGGEENEPPPLQVQLPPIPDVPPIARSSAPPAAVIGIFSFRDVMRASAAVQQMERILNERRDKLSQDVQKEQNTWRDLQQQLANQRATMAPEQIRAKERELQERVTNAQRQFRDRTRMLQESFQYGSAQVERVASRVLQQVAESRGMNLVLQREQVPLSAVEFDITEAVAEQLNKVMITVVIPPENKPLAQFAPTVAAPQPTTSTPPAGAPAGAKPAAATRSTAPTAPQPTTSTPPAGAPAGAKPAAATPSTTPAGPR